MGRACVWFPVNKSTLHPDMENNRSELLKIGQSMKTVRSHPASEIKKIQIDAYASPEGDETRNRELSLRRAEALKGYMKEAYQLPDSLFAVSARGENWEGLAEAIRLDESLTDTRRAELLRIVEADDEVATRKARLKSHQGGQSYQWLLREVFPLLRVSEYRIDYTLPETATNPDRELD
ncbi:MAG: OmpA family protein [Mediterranea sp.]|nr:OmpA family protein [Mediterranea sp.]